MKPNDKNIILEETRCLTPEELLRFRDNTMDASQRHRAEMHMVDCPLCSEAAEGIMLVSSAASLDKVREDVRLLAEKGHAAAPARKYWAAAASLAAIAVLASYMFYEYQKVQHPAVALQKEPVSVPAVENSDAYVAPEPQAAAVTGKAKMDERTLETETTAPLPEVSKEISAEEVITADEVKDVALDAEMTTAPAEHTDIQMNSQVTAPEADQTFLFRSQTSNQASYPKLSSAADMKKSRAKSPSSSSKKSERESDGSNVTYVHNLKVIDYRLEEQLLSEITTSGKSNTEPKYENKNQKEVAEAVNEGAVKKTSYLELIARPVELYKNKKYEAAVSAFDEVLFINPSDRNAMFYKGMSLYELKRFNDAIASLSGPANDVTGPFRDEARFYMAKAYKESGNKSIAEDIFTNLAAEGGFYAPRAAEELKLLR